MAIEKDLSSTAISLGQMCEVIDFLGTKAITAPIEKFDCCSNRSNFKTRCIQRRFNMGNPPIVVKDDDDAGRCPSDDLYCSVDDGM